VDEYTTGAEPTLLDHGIAYTIVQLPGFLGHGAIVVGEIPSSIHELAMEIKDEDFDGADFT
jgi:hypothetical protein